MKVEQLVETLEKKKADWMVAVKAVSMVIQWVELKGGYLACKLVE